jgi:hypothetical protein
VSLHRARGYEEGLGDLAVAEALASELGDTALAGGERVEPAGNDPAWARAGGAELGLGVFGEWAGARFAGGVQRLAEQLSSFGTSIPSPKHCAEVSGSPRSFQLGVTTLERVDRLTEQEPSTLTSGNDADGTLRDAYRA